ncbi:MAG: hypothetical protein RR162_08785, partial [Oscillospiraceae bacterium]
NVGVRVQCLTAWRYPKILCLYILAHLNGFVKIIFEKSHSFFLSRGEKLNVWDIKLKNLAKRGTIAV